MIPDCTIRTDNTAFRQLTRLHAKEMEGRSLPDLVSLLWGMTGLGEKLDELLRSPIGSTLDGSSGAFTWMPGVGFSGAYDFVFVQAASGQDISRQEVRVVLGARNREGSGFLTGRH